METLVAALIFVGCAVLFMCFNILFRKGKSFPQGEIGHNKELRKQGIICAKEAERRYWNKTNKKNRIECNQESNSCRDCGGGC